MSHTQKPTGAQESVTQTREAGQGAGDNRAEWTAQAFAKRAVAAFELQPVVGRRVIQVFPIFQPKLDIWIFLREIS